MTAISVTAKHIASGTPGSGWGCAVALAIEEAFPDADASVSEGTACLEFEDLEPVWLDLPGAASEFIEAYDNGWAEEIGPFTFELDYPEARPAS